jgi:tRNA(Leu) C34 or U34 (ribose-2'-O)-methylase TrmL
MLGQADSLNVGVATSIMIYEVLRKKKWVLSKIKNNKKKSKN